MLNVREKIKSVVFEALKSLNIEARDFAVEHPENISFGDYSTNVAMVVANGLGKYPFDIASEMVGSINGNLPSFLEKVEAVRPGFVNFHLSSNFLLESVDVVLEEGEKFGQSELLNNQKNNH
jgi:arginyl-tRNA synthetase